eukprot:1040951-Rhodomonas_salina.1
MPRTEGEFVLHNGDTKRHILFSEGKERPACFYEKENHPYERTHAISKAGEIEKFRRLVSTEFPNEYPANSKQLQSLQFYDAEEPPRYEKEMAPIPVLHTLQGLEEGKYPNDSKVYVCDICIVRELVASWQRLDPTTRPPLDQWFTVPSLRIKSSGSPYPEITVQLDSESKRKMLFQTKTQKPERPPHFNPNANIDEVEEVKQLIHKVSHDTRVGLETVVEEKNQTIENFKSKIGAKMVALLEELDNDPWNFKVFFEWEHNVVRAYLNAKTENTANEWQVLSRTLPNAKWIYCALTVLNVALQTLLQIKQLHLENKKMLEREKNDNTANKTEPHDLEHHVNAILALFTSIPLQHCYKIEIDHMNNNKIGNQDTLKTYREMFERTLEEVPNISKFIKKNTTKKRVLAQKLEELKKAIQNIKKRMERP